MRITTFSDYSLRVLIYLKQNEDRIAKISEISDYFQVSRNHIVKVVNNLARLGLIETIRGKGGGLRLFKMAESQKLGQLLKMLEPDSSLIQCVSREGLLCKVAPICNLVPVLDHALERFYAELDQYTLVDMVKTGEQQIIFSP